MNKRSRFKLRHLLTATLTVVITVPASEVLAQHGRFLPNANPGQPFDPSKPEDFVHTYGNLGTGNNPISFDQNVGAFGTIKFDYDTFLRNPTANAGGSALAGGFYQNPNWMVMPGMELHWVQTITPTLTPGTGITDWHLPASNPGRYPDSERTNPKYTFESLVNGVTPPNPPGVPTLGYTDLPSAPFALGANSNDFELGLATISNTANISMGGMNFRQVDVIDTFGWGHSYNATASVIGDITAIAPGTTKAWSDPTNAYLDTLNEFFDGQGGGGGTPPNDQPVVSGKFKFFNATNLFSLFKPANPQKGLTGNEVPRPQYVFGKEYSNNNDINDQSQPDPEQVLNWDAAAKDTFDFSATRQGDPQDRQVDALAHVGDHLFDLVTRNQVPLVISVEGDPNIYFERTNGSNGLWTKPPLATDVDGLELWDERGRVGRGRDDGDVYSLVGDPTIGAFGRVALWNSDSDMMNSALPVFSSLQIAQAVGCDENSTLINFKCSNLANIIDLDAAMMFGSNLMFSIAPVDLNGDNMFTLNDPTKDFDGGEIWVWDGVNVADFLFHGGDLWNTEFDVKDTFKVASENVNAIEAVAPEPLTIIASGLAVGFGVLFQREYTKKRRKK